MARFCRSGVFCLLAAILLGASGCDEGGGGSDGSTATPTATLSGTASKGPLTGATVRAYSVVNGARGELLGSATTTNGSYTLPLAATGSPILLEVSGGSYVDETTRKVTDLAVTLRAALPRLASGENKPAAVTPLTSVAVERAGLNSLTHDSIDKANKTLAKLVSPDCDLLADQPANLLDSDSMSKGSDRQKAYALMLGAVSRLTADPANGGLAKVLESIKSDLGDNKLDGMAASLGQAVSDLVKNDPAVAAAVPARIVTAVSDQLAAAQAGLTDATGDTAKAKQALADFMSAVDNGKDASASYSVVLAECAALGETQEANLFKAVATLLKIYKDNQAFFAAAGFDLAAPGHDLPVMVKKLLSNPDYAAMLGSLAANALPSLDVVLTQLGKAKGVNTAVSLGGIQSLSFDNADVLALEALVKGGKTLLLASQAVELKATDWSVKKVLYAYMNTLTPVPVTVTDFRNLFKFEGGVAAADLDTLLAKNPSLLTFKDPTKLTAVKEAFTAFRQATAATADALLAMSASDFKARGDHLFNLTNKDDAYQISAAVAFMESLEAAFANPAAVLKTYNDHVVKAELQMEADAAYPKETFKIVQYDAKSVGGVTIYDVMKDGAKAPRDLFGASGARYEEDRNRPSVFKDNLTRIAWDEPIALKRIPAVAITVDGNDADWATVPALHADATAFKTVKAARDDAGNLYLLVSLAEPLSTATGALSVYLEGEQFRYWHAMDTSNSTTYPWFFMMVNANQQLSAQGRTFSLYGSMDDGMSTADFDSRQHPEKFAIKTNTDASGMFTNMEVKFVGGYAGVSRSGYVQDLWLSLGKPDASGQPQYASRSVPAMKMVP